MTAVDRAALALLDRQGVELTCWRMWDASEWLDPPRPPASTIEHGVVRDEFNRISYRLLRGNLAEFLDADAVVYWGDFLHMRVYLSMTLDVLGRRMGLGPEVADEEWVARCLLLRGQTDAALGRTLSFGTTLSLDQPDRGDRYEQDFSRFVAGVRRIWFRDPYSAHVGQLHRPDPRENCKGVDAAMLLDVASGPRSTRGDEMAVFLGRSDVAPRWVGRFGAHLARELALRPTWLPWGREPAFWPMRARKRLRLAWPGLDLAAARPGHAEEARARLSVIGGRPPAPEPDVTFDKLLEIIADSRLVLTDTYHLAVLAWRLGTPAVCLTEAGETSSGWSVNLGHGGTARDKRVDLYSQLDVLPLLADPRREPTREARRICEVLGDDRVSVVGMRTLTRAAERAQADLLRELAGLVPGLGRMDA